MKRLDQVTDEDLTEFHSEMMGDETVDLLSLFQADARNAEEELLEKEFYEQQRDRHQDSSPDQKRA